MSWSKKMTRKTKKLLKKVHKRMVKKPKTPDSATALVLPLRHRQCEIPEEISKDIPPVPTELL